MAILLKGCKPDNFESHNSLKLSFTNNRGLRSNLVHCESFFESNSPDILALGETNFLGWLSWFWHFLCDGLSSFNPKGFYYSYAWSCSLRERRAFFCKGLISRKFCGFLRMFSTGFTSLSVLLLFPLSMHRFSIPSKIDEVLSIYPSANVFIFGDFNVHHIRTD